MKKPLCFLLISMCLFAFAVVRRSRVNARIEAKPDAAKVAIQARGLA